MSRERSRWARRVRFWLGGAVTVGLMVAAVVAWLWHSQAASVQVIDHVGHPVAGAEVVPASLSITWQAVRTDAQGMAAISTGRLQALQWLTVRCPGYRERQVSVADGMPGQVRLGPIVEAAQRE